MSRSPTTIYVVTLTAVYDHGCLGVFTSLDDAKNHCREMWAESDGHHNFRIDKMVLDQSVGSRALKTTFGASGSWQGRRKATLVPVDYIKVILTPPGDD